MPFSAAKSTLSPCVKLCTLDAAGQTCLGCGRTVTEIAAWSRMGDAARRAVMTRLDAARAASLQR